MAEPLVPPPRRRDGRSCGTDLARMGGGGGAVSKAESGEGVRGAPVASFLWGVAIR